MGSYNPCYEIWSIGVALVAMCTKRYPFNVRSKKKFSSQWRQFVKNHELNKYVRQLCHQTFSIDPRKRISSENMLADRYFSVSEDQLMLLSCKADPAEVREDSRVGAVSTVNLAPPENGRKSIIDKLKAMAKKKQMKTVAQPPVEEEQVDWAEVQQADQSGVDENATGFEGGNVGEEENLPAAEQEAESHLAEMAEPEEAEAEAQQEDGEQMEMDEGIQQTEPDQ